MDYTIIGPKFAQQVQVKLEKEINEFDGQHVYMQSPPLELEDIAWRCCESKMSKLADKEYDTEELPLLNKLGITYMFVYANKLWLCGTASNYLRAANKLRQMKKNLEVFAEHLSMYYEMDVTFTVITHKEGELNNILDNLKEDRVTWI